ncbi:pantoate--beta-alanine ligase [Candidatus Nitrospira neomarina]|uniref:Pantothenate synthetase n=1 Tax=Candidatus Nitrospira neomarina TaxID=3020899 RepID=A0AA96JUJ7_9BACT|nr:pantoate--beta-alanine ligase [Candidatus Nitrospira neomarina]WNM60657.1 pantoate--beta-alanine ligase [Candidatus Nitrospira neomarina]
MRVIHSVRNLHSWRRKQESLDGPIGFVPTMGALHEGHLSLMQRARKHCGTVVVSVFVNPLQFGEAEDLSRYPRSFHADRRLCREAGVDLLFAPPPEAFYPENFQTTVTVNRLTRRWEGEARPTHFQGVTTVVTKLFCLVRPHRVYFGQKDYQQSLVVNQLIHDLNWDMRMVLCPTVRESDGLAVSSRNRHLSANQRVQAGLLSKALREGGDAIKAGVRNVRTVQSRMEKILRSDPDVHPEYLAICNSRNLEPLTQVRGTVVILGAVRLGNIRLIDNLLVRCPPSHS